MPKKWMVLATLALLLGLLTACGAAGDAQLASEPPMEEMWVEKEVATGYASDAAVSNTSADEAQVERMIIWNANITLTVKDTQESIDKVQSIARDLGGYTTGSESWLSGEQLYAQVTIRVPAGRFEEAMASSINLASPS